VESSRLNCSTRVSKGICLHNVCQALGYFRSVNLFFELIFCFIRQRDGVGLSPVRKHHPETSRHLKAVSARLDIHATKQLAVRCCVQPACCHVPGEPIIWFEGICLRKSYSQPLCLRDPDNFWKKLRGPYLVSIRQWWPTGLRLGSTRKFLDNSRSTSQ